MSFFQNASNVIASNNNLTAVEGDQIRIDHQINQTTYNYYNLPSNTHEASATGSDLTVAISLTSSKIIAPIKPSVTALFLGRISELNALKERFYPRSRDEAQTRRSLLLYGMGGIGKTQIALRFGEETKHQFSRIFYIDASTVETITRSLKGIYVTTPELQSSKTVDGSSQSVVLDWISRLEEDWLMIYDNADEHVHKFVPSGNRGNILLTSRNRSVGRYTSFNAIEIQQMEEADAISLLLKASCLDQKSPANSPDSDLVKMAERIVTELHCHPLAVDQAGASIESGMCQIDNYLALYSQHRKDFLNDRAFSEASQYEKTVYGTLELSYKEIETRAKSNHSNSSSNLMYNSADIKAAQSALIILHLFAFLHHDSIDEDIFRQASAGYYNWDKAQDFFKPPNISLDGSTLLASNQQGTWDELYFKKGDQNSFVFFSYKTKPEFLWQFNLLFCPSFDSFME